MSDVVTKLYIQGKDIILDRYNYNVFESLLLPNFFSTKAVYYIALQSMPILTLLLIAESKSEITLINDTSNFRVLWNFQATAWFSISNMYNRHNFYSYELESKREREREREGDV